MKKCAEIKIVVMSSQESNILQFNQNMKSDKMSDIIQADLESLIKKIDGCAKHSRKIFNNKNRWTYSLWMFNVNYVGIW